jgi:CheY-like chemotaxis protein
VQRCVLNSRIFNYYMTYSVLIVDDNASLANLYMIVFERAGCQVRQTTNGQDALDYLADIRPGCRIMLDVMMPEMDGMEVCRRIRSDWPQPPPSIAIYTANTRPEVRQKCLEAGADFFSARISLSLNYPISWLDTCHLASTASLGCPNHFS